jgi:hypothetical protein
VDLARSSGVLGFVHHQGALYVHLAGPDPAHLVLTDRPPRTPYLERSSHRVTAWSQADGRLVVGVTGLGAKVVELAGLPPDRDLAVQIRDGAGARPLRARVGTDGRLSLAAGDASEVEIRLT